MRLSLPRRYSPGIWRLQPPPGHGLLGRSGSPWIRRLLPAPTEGWFHDDPALASPPGRAARPSRRRLAGGPRRTAGAVLPPARRFGRRPGELPLAAEVRRRPARPQRRGL